MPKPASIAYFRIVLLLETKQLFPGIGIEIQVCLDGKDSAAQVATGATASGKPNNKKKKAPFDKKDESSSKHKKKTGVDKLNPF